MKEVMDLSTLIPQLKKRKFYMYTARFTNLLPNVNQQKTISVQPDAYFLIQKTTYFSNINPIAAQTNNTRTVPAINVLVIDTGSGEQISDQAIPLYNYFGTGENPFVLPQPRLIDPNSALLVTATNVDVPAYDLTLAFVGMKLYR